MNAAQLPLNIQLSDEATFSNFLMTGNDELGKSLAFYLSQALSGLMYLWGGSGVGKTHLLLASCHRVSELSAVTFLDCYDKDTLSPDVLVGLEDYSLVCVDNIDAIAGNSEWEEAFFHCYNKIHDQQGAMMVSASVAPRALPLQLQDLVSRLSSGTTFQVKGLPDHEQINALRLRAQRRGLELSDEVGMYLLHRFPRNMKVLYALLEQLDKQSLITQRRLTIPFVKEVCQLLK